MRLKRRNRQGFTDSSASSDVAFLLIIYFIVIAGFNINKGFLMNLPARDSTRFVLQKDLLRFYMDDSGSIIHDGSVLDIPETETLIQSAQRVNPNIAVILSIDPRAAWQRVVSFVELAQDLQIDSFSFSMRRETP
ncbi:MAG: biopolymer transporter ExbD [Treponema sp.]|jgi:biopolymer transport protein ExbD|nr:biopolymer transporter ExbD [Treponema sp.]